MSTEVYDYIADEIAKFIGNSDEALHLQVTATACDAVRDDMGTGVGRDEYEAMLRGRSDRFEYEHAVGYAVRDTLRAWLDEYEQSPPVMLLRELLDLEATAISDRLGAHFLPTDADDINWYEDDDEDDDEDEDGQ